MSDSKEQAYERTNNAVNQCLDEVDRQRTTIKQRDATIAVLRGERDARVTVEEANRYGEWMLNKYNSTVYWSGILAWRTRTAVDGGGDGKDEGGGA